MHMYISISDENTANKKQMNNGNFATDFKGKTNPLCKVKHVQKSFGRFVCRNIKTKVQCFVLHHKNLEELGS